LSTAAFGVISAIVGAYLGIKIGTDQSKNMAADVRQAHSQLLEAVKARQSPDGGDAPPSDTKPPAPDDAVP
jgi:hypothetical protein